jgi:hypothetical protein
MSVILVSTLYRAPSSGWGEPIEKTFTTFEKASAYLKQCFEGYVSEIEEFDSWDDDDMFTKEGSNVPAPRPTLKMAEELFSVDALKAFVEDKKRYHDIIYGPWSEYQVQIPFEIQVKEVALD